MQISKWDFKIQRYLGDGRTEKYFIHERSPLPKAGGVCQGSAEDQEGHGFLDSKTVTLLCLEIEQYTASLCTLPSLCPF